MRALVSVLLAAALFSAPALAQPTTGLAETALAPAGPTVSVTLSPALRAAAQKTYGLPEVEALAEHLRMSVEKDLERMGVMAGGRVELVLVDAKPSRPTREQMRSKPGLSFRSVSLGGAAIEGQMIAFDGATLPVSFQWYASDLADSRRQAVWGDAHWTFERFSHRLSRGQLYALR
ncbi:hypothetical protein [Phenylobacterium sp.]|uniref:hypothetical protein n=1 Tax=Phenylobacterium sp. TaxID=1871053 RepID=UPI002731DC22|nr:hypothetical protein [Phenylobacterium sp.]MDP2212588.1 hypothetical protein [Phenylobacterium sp.]